MKTITGDIRKMTVQEMRDERYRLSSMLLSAVGQEDFETVDLIGLAIKTIDDRIDYLKKVALGEIEEIEDEAIEVEYEDVETEPVDWSMVKCSKETLDTITDFMTWIDTPVNNKSDITSDRTYQFAKQAERKMPIEDAAIEICDLVQDLKYDMMYKFMGYPKMHQYFAYEGYEHGAKMLTIYSMYQKYAVSKLVREIDTINKKNQSTPISAYDRTDDNGETYNPITDRLMATAIDEDEEDRNSCEEMLSTIAEDIMNLPRGPHSEEEIKAYRLNIVDGLEDIVDGKYDNASQMITDKKIYPKSYQNIVNKIRGGKTMNDISRQTGWYLVSELERQNDWSVEMMEGKYGTTKGINEGYEYPTNGETVTYKPGDKGYEEHYKVFKNLKKAW